MPENMFKALGEQYAQEEAALNSIGSPSADIQPVITPFETSQNSPTKIVLTEEERIKKSKAKEVGSTILRTAVKNKKITAEDASSIMVDLTYDKISLEDVRRKYGEESIRTNESINEPQTQAQDDINEVNKLINEDSSFIKPSYTPIDKVDGVNIREYENQTGDYINSEDVAKLNERRIEQQDEMDKFGNFLGRTGLKLVTGTVNYGLYAADVIAKNTTGRIINGIGWGLNQVGLDAEVIKDYGSLGSKLAATVDGITTEINTGIDNLMPIYKDSENTLGEDLSSSAGWYTLLESVIASQGAFAIIGGGVGSVVSKGAGLLGKGIRATGIAAKLVKADSKLALALSQATNKYGAAVATNIILNRVEARVEGAAVYRELYAEGIANGLSVDDSELRAKEGAELAMSTNFLNLALNMRSSMAFTGPGSTMTRAIKGLGFGGKKAGANALETAAEKPFVFKTVIGEQLKEAGEEVVNVFSEKSGKEYAKNGQFNGNLFNYGSVLDSYNKALTKTIADKETYLSAIGGFLGGGIQVGVTAIADRTYKKGDVYDELGNVLYETITDKKGNIQVVPKKQSAAASKQQFYDIAVSLNQSYKDATETVSLAENIVKGVTSAAHYKTAFQELAELDFNYTQGQLPGATPTMTEEEYKNKQNALTSRLANASFETAFRTGNAAQYEAMLIANKENFINTDLAILTAEYNVNSELERQAAIKNADTYLTTFKQLETAYKLSKGFTGGTAYYNAVSNKAWLENYEIPYYEELLQNHLSDPLVKAEIQKQKDSLLVDTQLKQSLRDTYKDLFAKKTLFVNDKKAYDDASALEDNNELTALNITDPVLEQTKKDSISANRLVKDKAVNDFLLQGDVSLFDTAFDSTNSTLFNKNTLSGKLTLIFKS